MKTPLIFILIVLLSLSSVAQKISGVNFVGPPHPIDESAFVPLKDLRSQYVSFIPFSYGKFGSPVLNWKGLENWQWWGESAQGVDACVRMAKEHGLKVMIKPQIWFDWGSFTGDFELDSDAEWHIFENSYSEYILLYAELAEKYDIEMLCIGTELREFVKQRPDFWKGLILQIRDVYGGQLTYAGNWDSYKYFPHWKDLDLIGVDAYFPVCDDKTPDVKNLISGWDKHYDELEKFAASRQMKILFTEYGYRSTDHCAKEPWDSSRGGELNFDGQYNAYDALFQKFWPQDWFAGGFLWKWYPIHGEAGGMGNNRFTPQNKPVQDLIREWYSRF